MSGYKRSEFKRGGERVPSLGQKGHRLTQNRFPSCLLRIFSFLVSFPPFHCSRVRVRLTSTRLSIFLGPLSRTELVFFPTYPGALHRSLRGKQEESGAPRLTSSRMHARPLVSLRFCPVIDGATFHCWTVGPPGEPDRRDNAVRYLTSDDDSNLVLCRIAALSLRIGDQSEQ